MDTRNFTIGVLSTTAVVLLVGLILVNQQPTAYASGMGDRGGDYIVLTGAMWDQEELLYVLNTAENKMMVYRYDMNTQQITARGPANLSRMFGEQRAPKPRRGRRNP